MRGTLFFSPLVSFGVPNARRFASRRASDHVTTALLASFFLVFFLVFCLNSTDREILQSDLVIDDWLQTLNWPPAANYCAAIAGGKMFRTRIQ